jgi:G2/mitotic-specific cyclin 2
LPPETLFLAIIITDRFLSARIMPLAKLQLAGIVRMFIAANVEEHVAPYASNLLCCADSTYTESEILQAEKSILKTID